MSDAVDEANATTGACVPAPGSPTVPTTADLDAIEAGPEGAPEGWEARDRG